MTRFEIYYRRSTDGKVIVIKLEDEEIPVKKIRCNVPTWSELRAPVAGRPHFILVGEASQIEWEGDAATFN